MGAKHTSWPWGIEQTSETLWVGPLRPDGCKVEQVVVGLNFDREMTDAAKARQIANAHLIAAAPDQHSALNYVADMTCIGVDGEWHFKPGYDPQVVLDAIATATPDPLRERRQGVR